MTMTHNDDDVAMHAWGDCPMCVCDGSGDESIHCPCDDPYAHGGDDNTQ